jgi:hypothetical protein
MDQVSLHVDIAGQNTAGTVFINLQARLVVVRWECHEDLVAVAELVTLAHGEMAGSGADTLVYDMRRLTCDEGKAADIMARVHAVKDAVVRRVAWIGAAPIEHAEIEVELRQRNIQSCWGSTFDSIGVALDAMGTEDGREPITCEKPNSFQATYAGSWYFLPELQATVMRTAGNIRDTELSAEMFHAGFELHKKAGASAVILDSSATPTIQDMGSYVHVYQNFVVPMGTSGLYKQTIHVRAGDPLFTEGAPPIGPLITSFGVPFYEVALMEDALSLLHLLRGKTRPVTSIRTIPAEAR